MQGKSGTGRARQPLRTMCAGMVAGVAMAISACGGGGGGGSSSGSGAVQRHVGGWVAGLTGSVALTINGTPAGTVSANGSFQLPTLVDQGASYTVGVQTQPSGGQCTVWQGSGTVGAADVSDVFVKCMAQTARYAFVVTDHDSVNGIPGYAAAYAVDPASGALRLVKRTTLQNTHPTSARWVGNIAVDPNGRFAYVVDSNNQFVLPFTVGADGSLAPISGSAPAPIGSVVADTVQLTIDPAGRHLYVVNAAAGAGVPANTVSQYSIGADGALTAVAGAATVATGAGPTEITFDPSGRYAYVTNVTDGTVSQYLVGADGGLTPNAAAATVKTSGSPTSVTTDPSGHFAYVLNLQPNQLPATIDQFNIQANGSLVPITGTPTVPTAGTTGAGSIAVDPSGKFVYAQDGLGGFSQYAVGTHGALVPAAASAGFFPATPASFAPKALAFDPSGHFVYAFSHTGSGGSDPLIAQFVIRSDGTLASSPALGTVGASTIRGFAMAAGTPVRATAERAYVANGTSNSLSQFAIDTANGSLVPATPGTVAAGIQPTFLSVDPTGQFVYAADGNAAFWNAFLPGYGGLGDKSISQYTLGTDGTLTANTVAATVAGGGGPLVIGADGTRAYQLDAGASTLTVFQVLADGTLSAPANGSVATGQVLASPPTPVALALHPSGLIGFVVNNGQNTIQQFDMISPPPTVSPAPPPSILTPSPVTQLPTGNSPVALAIHPSGAFTYVANFGDGTVSQYVLDLSSGMLSANTASATVAAGTQPVSIAIDPSGKYAYVANFGASTVSQYTVGADGVLTPISGAATVATRAQPISVAVDASGKYVFVSCFGNNTVAQYTIGANGALTLDVANPVVVTGANPAAIVTTNTWQ